MSQGGRTTLFFDSRWISTSVHGIGRVAREYRDRLRDDFELIELEDGPLPSNSRDFLFVARAFKRSKAQQYVTAGYNGSFLIRAPQVFFIHDLIHMEPAERNGRNGRLKTLYYHTAIRGAAQSSTVCTVSYAVEAAITGLWPELKNRVKVIPNGLSAPFSTPLPQDAAAPRSGVVLFANDRWHKNLPRMLDALALLAQAASASAAFPIRVIGKSPSIMDALQSRGLADRAVHEGVVSDERLQEILTGAAALMFCSLFEGFGLPIIEALSCGCPVVASAIPVLREISDDSCIFVDPTDVQAIAAGLRPALSETVAQAAIDRVLAKYDWERSYAQLRAAIQEAGARRR